MEARLIFATRPSALARWQTEYIIQQLQMQWQHLSCDQFLITTQGDRDLNTSLPEIGGKGLFTYELDRRFQKYGIQARAVAVHPGYSYTDFGRARFFRILRIAFYPLVVAVTQTSARGALPSLRAAVDPEVKGGDFLAPGGRFQIKGFPVKVSSNGASHNREDALLLWDLSEELTGISFLWPHVTK